ncbi:MAG: hypothetical protein WDN04_08445 [Rhodospirillales bacterium]
MLSLIAQYSKAGDAIIYPQTAIGRMRSFNPTDVLRRWEAVVGEKNVEVMCLDRLPAGAGIVENFAELAQLPLPKPGRELVAIGPWMQLPLPCCHTWHLNSVCRSPYFTMRIFRALSGAYRFRELKAIIVI